MNTKRIFLILPFLTCGCTFVPRATFETTYLNRALEAPGIAKQQNISIEAMQTSFRVEADLLEWNGIVVDLGIGPTFITPLDGRGETLGLEIVNRIRYKVTDWFEPYIFHSHGVNKFDQVWDPNPSDVGYGFTTQFGVGARFPINERFAFLVEWKPYWHNSWGKTKLGDGTLKMFGLPSDGRNAGFEVGGITIGFSFNF